MDQMQEQQKSRWYVPFTSLVELVAQQRLSLFWCIKPILRIKPLGIIQCYYYYCTN